MELISRIPASSENRVVDAATRARKLTTRAALKAATISGSLALPPGPLGLVTVLPDLYAVWRVQAQLVLDIAAVHGQTAFLSRETMAWCVFRHAAAQVVRDVVTRVGERVVVNRNGNRAHKNWHDGDATCARERGGALYPASGRSRRGRLRLQVIGHPEPAGQSIGGEGSAELLHGDAESLMDGISSSWRSAAARRNWVSAADRSPTRSARRPSPS